MKYYSEVTKKLYDTERQLAAAEADVIKQQAEAEEKKKARAARAKEVEDALKAVTEAQRHYTELKNKFIEDYGSFHVSLSEKTPVTKSGDINSLIDLLFNL